MTEKLPAFLEKPVVVINSRSGTAMRLSPGECAKLVREGFEFHGADVEVQCVEPNELSEAFERACAKSPSALIAGGGDGTVLAAALAVRRRGIPLGILPLGTFNHAARDLGLPLELRDTIHALASGRIEKIDMGEVNGKAFLCVCVLGFYPEEAYVDDAGRGARWWVKAFRYMMTSLRSFLSYPQLDLNLKTGSGTKSLKSRFVAVSNNPYTDTKGVMPHKDELNTGQLGIYVSTHRSLGRVAGASFAFLSGDLGRDPDVHTCQAEELEIACDRKKLKIMLDGEIMKEPPPLRFSINHEVLQVICPRKEDT